MKTDDKKSLDVLAGCIDKLTRLHPDEMGRVNAWIRAVMSECDKLAGEVERLRHDLQTARAQAAQVMVDAERARELEREVDAMMQTGWEKSE